MIWQPIETAPKDGSEVLIIDMTAISPKPDIAHYGFVPSFNGVWRCGDSELWAKKHELATEMFGFYEAPTHWMPLPPPPKQDQK